MKKAKKPKKIKNCAIFCREVRKLIPNEKLHSLVLNQGVKMGLFKKEFNRITMSYSIADGVEPTMEDVNQMAEIINAIKV
ncbi:MAG: hypothetical protein F6K61_21515 [Sphaerospermopsis sp. SIO1G1]|nr:hypothetical protein [Sphaerospermopsis sp. SIO1G1]